MGHRSRSDEQLQKIAWVTKTELSKLSGVKSSTIKFYTEQGLLPFKQADHKAYRFYNKKASLQRLNAIKTLAQRRIPITEIKELLKVIS